MSNYDLHLMRLRGFSDGAGSKPINPEYEFDSTYVWAYSYGQQTKRLFADFSATSLGLSLKTINFEDNKYRKESGVGE